MTGFARPLLEGIVPGIRMLQSAGPGTTSRQGQGTEVGISRSINIITPYPKITPKYSIRLFGYFEVIFELKSYSYNIRGGTSHRGWRTRCIETNLMRNC